MRKNRLYYPAALTKGQTLRLDASAKHYLTTVLKLSPGAPLIVFNGEGGEFEARLIGSSSLLLEEFILKSVESPLILHLAQGICTQSKMDWIIQKAVELGIHSITPILTQHSQAKLSTEKTPKRLEHWYKIMVHACQQSGRNVVPTLHQPASFESCLITQAEKSTLLLLTPDAPLSLSQWAQQLPKPTSLTLFVGPEGGFHRAEIQKAKDLGSVFLRLGPRILRTETAALVALSALQALRGDY